jgi:hypothetical protein
MSGRFSHFGNSDNEVRERERGISKKTLEDLRKLEKT